MKITLTELREILRCDKQRRRLKRRVRALLAERVALQQEISVLLAGDAALLAKAQAAFDKSETVEAKMRGAVPAQP